MDKKIEKRPSFLAAMFVFLFLIFAMAAQIFIIKNNDIAHITLLGVTVVTVVVAFISGFTWEDIQGGIMHGANLAMIPALILILVGVVVASWIPAGTIPSIIYYGLKILNPKIFLFTVCLICCIASLSTGSSWTTGATVGVAFMGIGMGLNIPPAMTAGAVISGAIIGDKMAPMSDSTNLAAAVAEADLFDHIKSMMYSTGPAIIISLIIYFFLGMKFSGDIDSSQIDLITTGLKENYFISPIAFLPMVIVIILAVKKVNGLAVMAIAGLLGGFFAITFGGYGIGEIMNAMDFGFVSKTGIAEVDRLLSRGGMQSMMWTTSLGLIALSLGGLFEKTYILDVLLGRLKGVTKSVGGLITTHTLMAIAINFFSASQHMAIIFSGRMLAPSYKEKGIQPSVCSRVCEDSATVTSPLVPWGLCGLFFTGALGVSTFEYAPYTFLAFLAPLITIAYGWTNKFIFKTEK